MYFGSVGSTIALLLYGYADVFCVCVEASAENRVLEVVLNPNFKSFDSEKQLSRVVFCSVQVPKEGEPSILKQITLYL